MSDTREHVVFYLKYRPQSLSELLGQDSVKKNLLSAFAENKLAHAYLLVGPRGTGKTSTARILAKMVNCEGKATEGEPRQRLGESVKGEVPCNKCVTCLSITDGSNLDLIEIDAASNRGIEDIRSLREKIKLAPSFAKKKVYIIDEVHMLTAEAFNALLKTLEEPPAHALFVLATTEGGKIPQTILSRVQRLDFTLATPSQLLLALEKIVKLEKIDIDTEALKLLVKKSDGSFRDAVKLLDQVCSLDGKITSLVLEKFFRSPIFEANLKLIAAFSKKDLTAGLQLVAEEMAQGADIKELVLSLMDILRNFIYIKNGLGDQLVKEKFSQTKFDDLVLLSKNFSNVDLVKFLDILQKAAEGIKFALIPSLPLEVAVLEICGEEHVESQNLQVDSPSPKLDEEYRESKIENPTSSPSTPLRTSLQSFDSFDPSMGLRTQDKSVQDKPSTVSDDIQKLKEKWTYVLETIRPFNFSLEALLRSINVAQCAGSQVVLEVPYSFHQRILEAPKNRDILESILSDVLGRQIKVSTVLGSRPVKVTDVVNIEVAQDDEIIRAAAEIFNSDSVN